MLHDALTERIRAEFLEMPGLRLTLDQAQRLCGIERAPCKTVLDALVDAKFLCVTSKGEYVRSHDGAMPRPPSAQTSTAIRGDATVASGVSEHLRIRGQELDQQVRRKAEGPK